MDAPGMPASLIRGREYAAGATSELAEAKLPLGACLVSTAHEHCRRHEHEAGQAGRDAAVTP